MSLTLTEQPTGLDLRKPAVLLTATLAAYVLYLVLAVATIADVVSTSADLTPAQLDDLGLAWPALHVLWMVPPILAAVALTRLSRVLGGITWPVPALASVTLVCAAAYLVVNLLAYGSDAASWGDDALYPWSYSLSLAAGWFGTIPATALVAVALARRGIARRTGWTVAVLVGLHGIVEVLSYLPVLVGSATFAGFEGGVPPFVLGLLWAVLAGGILRSGLPSQR
jgi:hypothetical protein